MWRSSGPTGPVPGPEQIQAMMRRSQAPDNEVPVTVPLGLVLGRSPDTAVLLPGAQVYSTGVSLDVVAVTRRRAAGQAFSMLMHGPTEPGPGVFLLGVELSDGRRASTLRGRGRRFDVPPDEPQLSPSGGGGGSRRMSSRHFLSPVPPPGRLVFVVSWTDWGIGETRTETSADAIVEAASRVEELWPWEPESPPEEPPSPPSPGGWFAR